MQVDPQLKTPKTAEPGVKEKVEKTIQQRRSQEFATRLLSAGPVYGLGLGLLSPVPRGCSCLEGFCSPLYSQGFCFKPLPGLGL